MQVPKSWRVPGLDPMHIADVDSFARRAETSTQHDGTVVPALMARRLPFPTRRTMCP